MIAKKSRTEGSLEKPSIVTHYDGDLHHAARLKMNIGSFYLPKDNVERPLGEDAHFVCKEKDTIGVADGVGGWAKKGIDPGKYARELMENCVMVLKDEPKGSVNPRRVLEEAYLNTLSKGSSTACIMTLGDDNFLKYVNLGDSGLMVFRDRRLMYKSPVQQRGFNHPYQLGRCSDTPSLAYEDKVAVKAGDIVVAGTDGWLDNMFPFEVLEIIDQTEMEAEILAWMIAENALCSAVDDDYTSPFGIAAEKAGYKHEGGKYDDITVVVAMIEPLCRV
ncbi:probable protein phosphatase 2C 55 [Ricinus communis]|uniref:Protein phosphatase n=1 Tax=Ricinus communis TaxID=3988 RepID=B9SG89_RICCO|nr:probable protein phosphatase 2C 55 [Ricinus communis]EEF37380.1 protein phosphatase 2c, putative [Ricinus communis]|eukprot:XP_002525008.1 probable protein phosphatase 2C 55 [Ricinus communis]